MNILPFLLCLQPILSRTSLRQLAIICEAIFTLTDPITLLSISRLTSTGGSYRTLQRFFASTLPWLNISWLLFHQYLFQADEIYLLAGDETVVTKSGNQTYGIDRFFASLSGKPVAGVSFFALSLLVVKQRRSYPISIQQIIRTEEEKAAHRKRHSDALLSRRVFAQRLRPSLECGHHCQNQSQNSETKQGESL